MSAPPAAAVATNGDSKDKGAATTNGSTATNGNGASKDGKDEHNYNNDPNPEDTENVISLLFWSW